MCVCVLDLMWHLKRSDSSRRLQREARLVLGVEVVYTQICEFSHTKRTGRKGDLTQRVMRFDSFQIHPLFV